MVLIILFIHNIALLEKTINSCFEQKYKKIEYVFVCNKKNICEIKSLYPSVKCIEEKKSMAEELESILSQSTSDYFTWFYTGEVLLENAINILVNSLEQDESLGMVVSNIAIFDKNGAHTISDVNEFNIKNVFYPNSKCFLIRKSTKDNIGKLDFSLDFMSKYVLFKMIFENSNVSLLNETLLITDRKYKLIIKSIFNYYDIKVLMDSLDKYSFAFLFKKFVLVYFPKLKQLKKDIINLYRNWDDYLASIYKFLYKNNGVKLQKKIKKDRIKIGMAVLVHERPELLEICLESLFNTNLYDYDITFLIHDDGSKDPLVRRIIEKKRDLKYKIVRIFSTKGHNSWGAAFNIAMHQLLKVDNFDIIGSCDSDVLFHPEWLDKTMKICLWAKEYHENDILGPFSSFNSTDRVFHECLGKYQSPYGNYIVKKRMGAVNYFYFLEDFKQLGYFEESKDDETLMTEKFNSMKVRNFCTEESFVEHIGDYSILNHWRPKAARCVRALDLISSGWKMPGEKIEGFPYLKLNSSLVLEMDGGELTDHLFHSHIPRIAKDSGKYNKVYISQQSKCVTEEIVDLVWKNNPYIDGYCSEGGIYASVTEADFDSNEINFLDMIMLVLGFDDSKRFHEPEIYYKPKKIERLVGKNLYDPNYIKQIGNITPNKIKEYLDNANLRIDCTVQVRNNFVVLNGNYEILRPVSLSEYCDMIYSVDKLVCLESETAILCAALGKSAIVLCDKNAEPILYHSRLHNYGKC